MWNKSQSFNVYNNVLCPIEFTHTEFKKWTYIYWKIQTVVGMVIEKAWAYDITVIMSRNITYNEMLKFFTFLCKTYAYSVRYN